MDQVTTLPRQPTPSRASLSDQSHDVLAFALDAHGHGPAALATLVEIRGGAARALGSHVAIAADGRFCGYVSGGCVEAAVASEALLAMRENKDRTVLFGTGSPFFDIALPCGGGITVAIHVLRDGQPLEEILQRRLRREASHLVYDPVSQSLSVGLGAKRAGWREGRFESDYQPATRLVISGTTAESFVLAHLANAAGYEVMTVPGDHGHWIETVTFDTYSAAILLHHDLDAEAALLEASLRSPAFYVGALGSTRTHRQRVERLDRAGFTKAQIDRIRAPIGLFGPTRDATSLALSILADVAAARAARFG